MRTLVAGGTGFLGRAVCRALRAEGHTVTVVSRDPGHAEEGAIGWPAVPEAVGDHEAIVNLAGEPIAGGRWTKSRKERILNSRVGATRALIEAVGGNPRRPVLLVNASAVGYYGPHDDEPLDETAPAGHDFLATVCEAWENEARRAEDFNLRVVRLRFGIVLASDGGALARMMPLFRAFVGGPLGDGRQWMSWIHRDDVTGIIAAVLREGRYHGAVNVTAPEPVTNREFATALGGTLARPSALAAPAAALRLVFGEMADVLLTGQRVLPRVAQQLGYRFRYPDLSTALRASARR